MATQEIEAKRPQGVENDGGGGTSDDSNGFIKKIIEVPNGKLSNIIGMSFAGETLKRLQLMSGAEIQITRDMEADPNSATRAVEILGYPDQVSKAEKLIMKAIAPTHSVIDPVEAAKHYKSPFRIPFM